MRMMKAAFVFGTAMVLTTAALAAPGKTKAAFFNKALVTAIVPRGNQAGQDTVKSTIRPLVISKIGKNIFCAENSTDESGKTYSRAVLDISSKTLMKAARKEKVEEVDVKDLVGAYNVSGLKILLFRFGVIAMRDGSNSRDPIEDLWTFESEIKNVQVLPYGSGKDNLAVIKITTVDNKETALVLCAENGAHKLLRELDTSKNPGKPVL